MYVRGTVYHHRTANCIHAVDLIAARVLHSSTRRERRHAHPLILLCGASGPSQCALLIAARHQTERATLSGRKRNGRCWRIECMQNIADQSKSGLRRLYNFSCPASILCPLRFPITDGRNASRASSWTVIGCRSCVTTLDSILTGEATM